MSSFDPAGPDAPFVPLPPEAYARRMAGGMVNQYRIGPTGEWDEARNVGGMQDRVQDQIANYQTHSGPGGYVGVAPTMHGGNVVQLHAADGTIESWRMFAKKRMMSGGPVEGGLDWREQPNWRTASRVENVRVSSLIPIRQIDRETHPRGRDFGYLDELTEKIRAEGFDPTKPVVVEYDPFRHSAYVGDGNHRLAVAQRLGMETVPTTISVQQRRQAKQRGSRLAGESSTHPDGTGYVPHSLPPSWVGLRQEGGPVWKRLLQSSQLQTRRMARRAASRYSERYRGFMDNDLDLGGWGETAARRLPEAELSERFTAKPSDLDEMLGRMGPRSRQSETETLKRLWGRPPIQAASQLQHATRFEQLEEDPIIPPAFRGGDPRAMRNALRILQRSVRTAYSHNVEPHFTGAWENIERGLKFLPKTNAFPINTRPWGLPFHGATGGPEDLDLFPGQFTHGYPRTMRDVHGDVTGGTYPGQNAGLDQLKAKDFSDPTQFTDAGYKTIHGLMEGRHNARGGMVKHAMGGARYDSGGFKDFLHRHRFEDGIVKHRHGGPSNHEHRQRDPMDIGFAKWVPYREGQEPKRFEDPDGFMAGGKVRHAARGAVWNSRMGALWNPRRSDFGITGRQYAADVAGREMQEHEEYAEGHKIPGRLGRDFVGHDRAWAGNIPDDLNGEQWLRDMDQGLLDRDWMKKPLGLEGGIDFGRGFRMQSRQPVYDRRLPKYSFRDRYYPMGTEADIELDKAQWPDILKDPGHAYEDLMSRFFRAHGPKKIKHAGVGARALRSLLSQGPGGGGTYPVDPNVAVPTTGHALGISAYLPGATSYHVPANDPKAFMRAFRTQQKAGAPFVGTWWDPATDLIDVDPSTVIQDKIGANRVLVGSGRLRDGGEKAAYDLTPTPQDPYGHTWYRTRSRAKVIRDAAGLLEIIMGRRRRADGGPVHAQHGVKFELEGMRGDLRSRIRDTFEELLDRYPAVGRPLTEARPHLAPGLPTLGWVGMGPDRPYANYGHPDYDQIPGSRGYSGTHFVPGHITFSEEAFGTTPKGHGGLYLPSKRAWWAQSVHSSDSESLDYFDRKGNLLAGHEVDPFTGEPRDRRTQFSPGTATASSIATHEFGHALDQYIQGSEPVGHTWHEDPSDPGIGHMSSDTLGAKAYDLRQMLTGRPADTISGYSSTSRLNNPRSYFPRKPNRGDPTEPWAELFSAIETPGATSKHIRPKRMVTSMQEILEELRGRRQHGGPVARFDGNKFYTAAGKVISAESYFQIDPSLRTRHPLEIEAEQRHTETMLGASDQQLARGYAWYPMNRAIHEMLGTVYGRPDIDRLIGSSGAMSPAARYPAEVLGLEELLQGHGHLAARKYGLYGERTKAGESILNNLADPHGRKIEDYIGSTRLANLFPRRRQTPSSHYATDKWQLRLLQGKWEPDESEGAWWATKTGGLTAARSLQKQFGMLPPAQQAVTWGVARDKWLSPEGLFGHSADKKNLMAERIATQQYAGLIQRVGQTHPEILRAWGFDPKTGLWMPDKKLVLPGSRKRAEGGYVESLMGSWEPWMGYQLAQEALAKRKDAKHAQDGAWTRLGKGAHTEPGAEWFHYLPDVEHGIPWRSPASRIHHPSELQLSETEKIRWESVEHGLVMPPNSGDVITRHVIGDKGSVRLGPIGNKVAIHNHPYDLGSTLGNGLAPMIETVRPSNGDVGVLFSNQALEGWSVTPSSTAIMRAPAWINRPGIGGPMAAASANMGPKVYLEQAINALELKGLIPASHAKTLREGRGSDTQWGDILSLFNSPHVASNNDIWDRVMSAIGGTTGLEYLRFPSSMHRTTSRPKGMELETWKRFPKMMENKVFHMAGGGQADGGLYIVGEVGPELFVPQSMAHLIPKKVMDQIPRAAGGMQVIGQKPNSLFAPPEDGIIVPNRLMDQIPHAIRGADFLRNLAQGFGRSMGAAAPKGFPNIEANPPGAGTTFEPSGAMRGPFGSFVAGSSVHGEDAPPAWERLVGNPNRATPPPVINLEPPNNSRARHSGYVDDGSGAESLGRARQHYNVTPPRWGRYARAGSPVWEEASPAAETAAGPGPAGPGPATGGGGTTGGAATGRAGDGGRIVRVFVINWPAGGIGGGGTGSGKSGFRRRSGGVGPAEHSSQAGSDADFQAQHGAAPTEAGSAPTEAGTARRKPEGQLPEARLRHYESLREAASIAAQSLAARTPRGMAAVAGSMIFGGRGENVALVAKQRRLFADVEQHEKYARGVTDQAGENVGQEQTNQYLKIMNDDLPEARGKEKEALKDQAKILRGLNPELDKMAKAEEELAKTAPGAMAGVKNFVGILAGVQVYSMAMQGVGVAMAAAMPELEKLGDLFLGFAPSATKITGALADQTREQGGNARAAIAAAAATGGMSAEVGSWVEQALVSSVVAKSAAKSYADASKLIRGSIGMKGGAEGLYGGYGGVLGSPFMGEFMGGGKGLAEQVLGDINAARGKTGLNLSGTAAGAAAGLGVGTAATVATGGFALPAAAVTTGVGAAIGLYSDITSGNIGGGGTPLSDPTSKTKAETMVVKTIQDAMGRAEERGGLPSGQLDFQYKGEEAKKAYESPAAAQMPTMLKNLAKAGYAITNSAGQISTDFEEVDAAWKLIAEGLTIPDFAEWSKTIERELNAQFQAMDISSIFNRAIAIPLQFAVQRIAQPLLAPETGLIPQGQDPLKFLKSQGISGTQAQGIVDSMDRAATIQVELADRDKLARQDAMKLISKQPGYEANVAAAQQSVMPIKPSAPSPAGLSPAAVRKWMDAQTTTFDDIGDVWDVLTGGIQDFIASLPSNKPKPETGAMIGGAPGSGGRPPTVRQPEGPVINASTGFPMTGEYSKQAPGQAEAKEYDRLMSSAQSASTRLKDLQEGIASLSATATGLQWANTMRISLRGIADATNYLAGSSKKAAGNLGLVQHQLWDLGRKSQSLNLQLQQRQITTNLAVAQFQAPGETGEERYFRQKEAIATAGIQQTQLDISKEVFAKQLTEWTIMASRAVEDANKAWEAAEAMFRAQTEAAGKAAEIANLSAQIAADLAAASDIYETAAGKFSAAQKIATQFATTFGGSINAMVIKANELTDTFGDSAKGMRQFLVALGFTFDKNLDGSYTVGKPPTITGATGLLGTTSGATSMVVGEAGTEHVAVLRNPRLGSIAPQGGGGGATSVTVNINGASVRNDQDISSLAMAVAAEVERTLSRKGQMFGLRGPAV